jgi:superfamily II DNA or RNA helicase
MAETELHFFELNNFDLRTWSYGSLLRYLPPELSSLSRRSHKVTIEEASTEAMLLTVSSPTQVASVTMRLEEGKLHLGCSCLASNGKPCVFQVQGVLNLMENPDVRIFFDKDKRNAQIRLESRRYGLEELNDPEEEFELVWQDDRPVVKPKNRHLQSADEGDLQQLATQLVPAIPVVQEWSQEATKILVWTQSRFQEHFYLTVFEAFIAGNGSLRGPMRQLHAVDLLLEADDAALLRFYGAVAKFQDVHRTVGQITDRQAFTWLLKNPENLPVYIHNFSISETVSPQALRKVEMVAKGMEMSLTVYQNGDYFEVVGVLTIEGKLFDLLETRLRYGHFLLAGDRLHFIERDGMKELLEYLQRNRNKVVLHKSKFEAFRKAILERVESYVRVVYSYLKPATARQRKELDFDQPPQKIVYLDDAGQYVHITPAMVYGQVEVPVFSPRILYCVDAQGRPFQVERDARIELEFATSVLMAHPAFPDQVGQDHVYLHKTLFLDENWFLETFEEWRRQGIAILGFQTIKNNGLNPYKGQVHVSVVSGIDWFETKVEVKFGGEIVPLRQLYTSVRNKTRYVLLQDGTKGILPEEWMEKLGNYFRLGSIDGEVIRTLRQRYQDVRSYYADEYLSPAVKADIKGLEDQLNSTDVIPEVSLPSGLQVVLRDYQYEGVKWLSFMSDLNFGACLADDMGLGKTLQVITFLLLEKRKSPGKPSLVIVPSSLLFNWQLEIQKHAPGLTFAAYYGEGRRMSFVEQKAYDVILTTYSVMVAEIHRLRAHTYHYVVLDESQNIKNPGSQRYRAACQLKSKNRIIMTGTPIENNTLDLFGQFSFVVPGLLGSRRYFKDQYFMPINKFRESKKVEELQARIRPFLLRRVKEQVARQLPKKSEMVIYCEMGAEQRRVYDAYAEEFRNYLSGRDDGDISRQKLHILQGLTKLRQICISPTLLNDEEYYGAASAKVEVLLEQLEALVPHHKVLVFSQFVTALDLVKKELDLRKIGYSYLVGSTTRREKVVEEFQQEESKRVFLISLKAGGTGLNLTAADYVFMLDPWWNPATENQAIDRVHRIGQDKQVMAVRLICPDTIEERVIQLQENKKELTEGLIRTEATLVKELDKASLLSLL